MEYFVVLWICGVGCWCGVTVSGCHLTQSVVLRVECEQPTRLCKVVPTTYHGPEVARQPAALKATKHCHYWFSANSDGSDESDRNATIAE